MLRRLLIAAVFCAATGVLAAPALAVPFRPGGIDTVTSQHFMVWYDGDKTKADYITQTQATTLAGLAESAYATETGWGYQPPVDDGDGHIDIFVVDLSTFPGVAGFAVPDGGGAPQSGSIDFAQSIVSGDWELHTVAHELFHLIQFRYWAPANADHWLLEGQAEWAGYKVDNYNRVSGSTGPPELSLDCFDAGGLNKCSPDSYANGGYSRWPFYELLAQRYGNDFSLGALQQAQALGSATAGLQAALATKGATLADAFNDWALRQVTGGWTIAALDSEVPKVVGAAIPTGATNGAIPTLTVPVDHLATRFYKFTRGDGDGGHACFAATLALRVTIPAGTNGRPYFYWSGAGPTTTALTINGSTATASIPWDTCLWPKGAGYLVLPNDSTTVDAANYVVTGTLTVDPNTPATPGVAPGPAAVNGPVVAVPTADIPPAINVLSPLLLHLSASSPTLRLIVSANGEGSLQAKLGTVDLGTAQLRPGSNDVRFAVPKSLLTALRRSSAAGNLLTLTPVSTSGAVTGQAVTRQVAVTPVAKKKKK